MIVCGEERNVRAPKELHEFITATGGRNPHGEPMYRLVWGWERKEWKGGAAANGMPKLDFVPKYPQRERFHLEVWGGPWHYGTREQWAADTHRVIAGQLIETLGPYPAEGEYEHLFCFEDERGRFLTPTKALCLRAIAQHKAAQNMHRLERIKQRERIEEQEKASRDSEKRTATRELAKEFVERALPGRTVQQLKEELSAPPQRKKGKR